MRYIITRFSLVTVLLLLSVSLFAESFEVNGINYSIIPWERYLVEVISKQGGYSGEIIIPESVSYEGKTYSVTDIGQYAFHGCSSLTSVTIPNSVTWIIAYAFYGCSSLSSVTIGNSVTSIGYRAFSGCSSLTSVTIPNSVTSIGSEAFEGCSGLKSVTIGNSVTEIDDSAFKGCSSLTSVTIPNSVTEIGGGAFRNCSSLASVIIPNGVTSIKGNYLNGGTFEGCSSLTSVIIPNSVTKIEDSAFKGCSSLTSVTIPNSVTSIGREAFERCSGLKSVTIGNSVTKIDEYAFRGCSGLTSVTLYCKEVGSWFREMSSIKEVIMGDGVEGAAPWAFRGCGGLTSVTIGNSVKFISDLTFLGCISLTSVTLNCKEVGSWFYGMTSIKEVILGDSVTFIAQYAFRGCSGLTSVTIGNSVTSIGDYAFSGCSSLTSVTIPNSVTEIDDSAFKGCSSLTSVTIPNSVTSIENEAFKDCSSLTSVTIPNSVTYIGYSAFPNNVILKLLGETPPQLDVFKNDYYQKIEVPKGSSCRYATTENWEKTDTIYAMDGNTILYPVIIRKGLSIVAVNGNPEGVEVTEGAEVEVTNYNSQYLPYSLVMINNCEMTDMIIRDGKYVFKASSDFKRNIISTCTYPYKDISLSESGTLIDKVGLEMIDGLECIKVSGDINGTDILTIRKMKNLKLLDLSDAHIINGGMSYYKNYTTSEKTIGEYFYEGLNQLLRIKLPNDIHTINKNAFYSCKSIQTIKVPSTVNKISFVSMLNELKGLQSLQLEDLEKWCLVKITDSPYANDYGHGIHLYLKGEEVFDLEIPEGITEITSSRFYCCDWLKSVKIPSAVKEIGAYSFWRCNNIASVTSLNSTPPHIEYQHNSSTEGAFVSKVEENATLYVPQGCKTIYWLHPLWERFKNIVELDDTSINDVIVDSPKISKGVYTIDGVKVSANTDDIKSLPKGIYIVNGEKVIIK